MNEPVTAKWILRFFLVDIPTDFSEDESLAMLHYGDAQENVSMARLDILRAFWARLYGKREAA